MTTSSPPHTRTVTISIPRTAIGHALVGLALASLATAAVALHASLPPGSPHRAALLTLGGLAGAGAGLYWLWCSLKRVRADQARTLHALQRQEERDRAAAARASAILAAAEQAHRDHKEHIEQVSELIGAVEALQDCYLSDGARP